MAQNPSPRSPQHHQLRPLDDNSEPNTATGFLPQHLSIDPSALGRYSTASSLGGFYDHYRDSSSQAARQSAGSSVYPPSEDDQQHSQPVGLGLNSPELGRMALGFSTARRNSSPSQDSTATFVYDNLVNPQPSTSRQTVEEQGSGLHKRNSGRFRKGSESETAREELAATASAGRTRTVSSEPHHAQTDPLSHQQHSVAGALGNSSAYQFDPRYSLATSGYSLPSHAPLARVDSHPFSLAPSTIHSANSDEDDFEPPITGESHQSSLASSSRPVMYMRGQRLTDEDDVFDSNSPLQPASSTPPPDRSPGHPFTLPRHRGLFPSPSASPGSRHSRGRSPGSSPHRVAMYPQGSASSHLERTSTLSRAAAGLRRMSLRVVNLADTPAATLLDRKNSSPSRTKHPHRRMSVQEDGFVDPSTVDSKDGDDGTATDDEPPPYQHLRGRTLGIFGPNNSLRLLCAKVLKWRITEPLILISILASVVLLIIQSAPDVYEHPRPISGYFHGWVDFALFGLFCLFSAEIVAKIIVTGLVINPPLPPGMSPRPSYSKSQPGEGTAVKGSTLPAVGAISNFSASVLSHLGPKSNAYPPRDYTASPSRYAAVEAEMSQVDLSTVKLEANAGTIDGKDSTLSKLATGKVRASGAIPFVQSVRKQRTTYQDAFLRHSWNRIDALAVVSFWICFVLAMTGAEAGHNVYIFRSLSVLRAARLLAVTEGTTTILHSLKRASPQLVELGFFVAFAMILFSIIGIQTFRGSYRRTCMWVDPAGQLGNVSLSQLCGGYTNETGGEVGYLTADGQQATASGKGFICQYPAVCVEDSNPDNGATSFDNIFAALFQIVVVASANTWTTVMFNMMDAEYFASCLFFIFAVVVLNFWLINMFVAVITSSFADIREETKHSAFASKKLDNTGMDALGADQSPVQSRGFGRGTNWVRKAYAWTDRWWVALIAVDIVFQGMSSVNMTDDKARMLSRIELGFTLALDLEMVIRFIALLPHWRHLFAKPQNATDLFLAVATTIIQIPLIKHSLAYKWLTFFQIARSYRVILSIPRMKRLIIKLTGTITGLVNMVIFLLLMNLVVALISVQLFRGIPNPDTDETSEMTYAQIFNSFLATYQILSSENWTDVVNNVLTNELGQMQIVIAAILLGSWLLFGYFVLIQLFIAVINENFAIAEEEKRKQQLHAFVERDRPEDSHASWIMRWNPYNYLRARPKAVAVDAIPSSLVLPMKKAVVRDYMTDTNPHPLGKGETKPSVPTALVAKAKRALRMSAQEENLPMAELKSTMDARTADEPTGELFPATERTLQYQYEEHAQGIASEHRARQADFITAHPSYDRSLWVFSQRNPLRQVCQMLVDPAYGEERIKGRPANPRLRVIFQAVIFFSIVGSVVVAGIATPVYRKGYYDQNPNSTWNWFNLSEVALSLFFFLEFAVKVTADGFVFAPNAYLLSIWNQLDALVLLTIIINVVTTLVDPLGRNRFVRALKAFRALRLINLNQTMRTTFYNVLIVGIGRILDASALAVLYIIPYAIWGQKVFQGLLYFCNDSSVATKAECAGEFASAVVDDWTIMMPRVWQNPYVWSFDTFQSSLLILFEIISLEGWISVMESVMQITGPGLQPQQDAAQFNSLFFVAYNLIGAVFILTLFVSIIIENFTHRSGMALLTTEQRQWIDLKRLIIRQRPAKRPKVRPSTPWRSWCFDRAVQKHGWWSRMMTAVYLFHIVALMSESTNDPAWAGDARNWVFLGFTVIYGLDIAVKLSGLGWRSFRQNGWNLYDVLMVAGTFGTTLVVLRGTDNNGAEQAQKLFLVAIAFKLVQKNNSLNQLFKTAAASVPAIVNIFALWIILFLVFAILQSEVFGLTRWGPNGTHLANYSSFLRALVMLALASTGEGWNAFMHDYTLEFPNCTHSNNYLNDDCGSPAWAYVLFIFWNVLSMYLMSNLILGAVVENFSGVFQKYGKVTSIDREQMRAFKKVWEQFDVGRKGYLPRDKLVPFFGQLTGVFEVKIFPSQYSIDSLRTNATVGDPDRPGALPDPTRLQRELSRLDSKEIKRRKALYNKLYHEAMIASENEQGGIRFTQMLLLLSHYCLIDDDKALKFEDLIERRERMDKVMDRVHNDRVRTLLKTIVLRRKYLALRAASIQAQHGVPAINVVDDAGEEEELHLQSTPRPDKLNIDTSFDTFRSSTSTVTRRSGADSAVTPPDSPLYSPSRPAFALSPASPDRSNSAISPTSMSDDEGGGGMFDRSNDSFERSGSFRTHGRDSITAEEGEIAISHMMGRWGGAFAVDDEDDQ